MATEEEDNYVRVALLLNGVSPRAVRVYFDQEFAPSCLERTLRQGRNTLKELKTMRVINQTQWNLLFPGIGRTPDSTSFDISLMTILLKNLASIAVPDHLPVDTDSSVGAALGIIKYYRNHLAHLHDSKIENNQFENMWTAISKAIKTIGGDLMNEETKKLKTNVIDRSNREIMLTLRQFSDEIKDLKHNLQSLEQQVKDLVPQNIREVIQLEIEEWKKDDKMFFFTSTAKAILQCCEENFCVLIIGSSGMGKTATLRHVALKMADKGYDLIPVHEPGEIKQYYNPNTKTVFVIDNLCGKFSAQKSEVEKWEHFLGHFCRYIKKDVVKIIISCRLQVFKDELFDNLTLFKTCICDLTSKNFKLSDKDLKSIAELYVDNVNEVVQYANEHDCFPFLCKQYNECPSLDLHFFQNPYSVYENELNQMFLNQNYTQVCSLALCVMFNNSVKEEWLKQTIDSDPEIRAVFKNTFAECKLNRGTSRLIILDSFNTLLNTYLIKADTVYKVKHDKLFDILSHYFGNKMLECMIQFANINLIGERFVIQDQEEVRRELITKVPPTLLDLYIRRMVDEWSKGKVTDVFSNINFSKKQFLESFCHHVTSLEVSKQAQLAKRVDGFNISVLHLCCKLGDLSFTKWALKNGASVNIFNNYNISSPLFLACAKGHTEVVKLLLYYKADVNKCTTDRRTTPLHVACKAGHTDIVNILLQHNADLNICTEPKVYSSFFFDASHDGTTPLFQACAKGHTEVVKLLLYYKADVNKCTTDTRATPLHVACQEGHTDIVKILLQHNANLNICTEPKFCLPPFFFDASHDGTTPLFLACAKGHTEVVKLLLYYKADVNKCTTDRRATPLHVACQEGYKDIVNILLQQNADPNISNRCTKYKDAFLFFNASHHGTTPLFQACAEGHTEVVKLLLYYKADVNKCTTDTRATPLHVAYKAGHTDIVNILLQHNADPNICTKPKVLSFFFEAKHDGTTLLFQACAKGHTEVVKLLLYYKADVNKCTTDTRATPLHVACQEGYKDIVNILLQHNVDPNICTKPTYCLPPFFFDVSHDGTTPLFLACAKGHTEVVKLLLYYKADVNKCTTDTRTTPLHVACKEGHTDIVNILLQHKADPNISYICTEHKGMFPFLDASHDGTTPLFQACAKGHTEVVKLLLYYKADVNKCTTDTRTTPLHVACKEGHTDIVNILLQHKADPNISYICTEHEGMFPFLDASHDGTTPLFQACAKGHTEVVKLLLYYKADVNKCTTDTRTTPLHVACKEGYKDIVNTLLQHNADPNICIRPQVLSSFFDASHDGTTPLFQACAKGHTEVVKLLLYYKADVNKCTTDTRTTPLHVACKEGHTDIVNILLQHKADPNISYICTEHEGMFPFLDASHDGTTPLFQACAKGHTEVVKLLLYYKADVNKCTTDTRTTPLHVACKEGHTDIVNILLQHKADPNISYICTEHEGMFPFLDASHDGTTPLFQACAKGHTEVVKLLLYYKADVNKCTTDTRATPLHVASQEGYKDIVNILLDNNACINATTNKEMTPLSFACMNGHLELVGVLLKRNADPHICAVIGMLPLCTDCSFNKKSLQIFTR